jgi:outer membrane protein
VTTRPAQLTLLCAALLAAALAPASAHALQPLAEFLAAARRQNPDNREAALVVRQREHQIDQQKWDYTPTISATAGYTRNQYEVKVTLPGADPANPITRTITPFNQLDAQLTLTQPIVDVGILRNLELAKANRAASEARVASTRLQVDQSVAQAYYQVVAAEAFIAATEEVFQAARASLEIVQQRAAAGVASDLDRRRAEVEVERGRKSIADAEYNLAIARQRLVSLAGVEPEPTTADPSITVSLADEAPLPSFVDGNIDQVASVKADLADARTSEVQVRGATALFFPTLSASANERFTNATGFLGKYSIASASLNLSWRLDLAIIPQLRAAKTQAQLAQVRVDRSRQRVYDQIHNAWHQVKAAIAKARSARVERDTTRAAHKQARQRYEAGTGIFLEVTQAERDAFSAHISLIQANADLAYARIALRLAAGRDPKDADALLRADSPEPAQEAPAPANPDTPPPLAPQELGR